MRPQGAAATQAGARTRATRPVGTSRRRSQRMTSVVTIGYPQQSTAAAAAEHLHRVTPDFLSGSDAVAVLSRDAEGVIHLATSHESPSQGRLLGLFWPPLLGPLCFGPILGSSATGPWRELERVVIQAGLVRALRAP